MKKRVALASAVFLLLPFIASAQSVSVGSLLLIVGTTLKSLIPLAIGLAVVIFLFGVIKYVTAGDSDENRKTARMTMLYGIIALFVMVSVWGLVQVLNTTTGIGQGGGGIPPTIPPIVP